MKVGYPVDDDDKGMPCLIDVGGSYALLSDTHLAGGSGGVQYTEGDEVTDPATGPLVMLKRDDVLASLPAGTDENDAAPARCNANGAQWVALDDSDPPSVAISGVPHVEVDSRPAIDNSTDAITAVEHSGVVMVGLDEKPVQRVNTTLSADGSIIAAPGAGLAIRVTEFYAYPTGGANTFQIEDGSGGTTLFGPQPLAANQPLRLKSVHGVFDDCTANTALHLNITNATDILFLVHYIVVDA